MILLPFDFKKIGNQNVLLVNLSGEYSVINEQDFLNVINEDFNLVKENITDELLAKQFICYRDNLSLAEDMLANKLRSRKNFLSDFTSLHMIVLTLNCNCACDYCHASSKGLYAAGYNMNLSTAANTVDTIFSSPSPYIKIEFQGGEPLLNWHILKDIVLQAELKNKQYRKNLSFVICTNLLEISCEQIDFIKKHNIMLSTSCDGNKKLHDNHRKSLINDSSYDTFIKNLHKCRNSLGQDYVSALLTVTRDNMFKLQDVIDHYRALNFNNIFIRALNPYGYAVQNEKELGYSTNEFIAEYKKALKYIIDINLSGGYFVDSYATLILQRILTPFSTGFVDLQSPSGAGIGGAIYNYNGDVYPADEARMLASSGDKTFKMGNVNTDSYYDIFTGGIIQNIVKNSCVESMPGCAYCPYKIYCGSDPIRYYVESKDIVGKRYSSDFCKKTSAIIEEIFRYLCLHDNEDILDVFWSWINHAPLGVNNNVRN